jgi:hypothetical protein
LSGGAESRIGHVFAATVDGSLREVRIDIRKDAALPGGDYLVQLLATSGAPAEPDHTALGVLAVAIVPDATVPDGDSTLVAEFNGPDLVAGTEYGVVVARPGSPQLAVQKLALPAICLGTAVRTDDAEDEFLLINFDVIVEVLVA